MTAAVGIARGWRHEFRADGVRDRFGNDAIDGRPPFVIEVPIEHIADRRQWALSYFLWRRSPPRPPGDISPASSFDRAGSWGNRKLVDKSVDGLTLHP